MLLAPQDITRLAKQMRLAPGEPDCALWLGQLNRFFDLVQAIATIDTKGVEPLAHPASLYLDEGVTLGLRGDAPSAASAPVPRDAAQANAPAAQDGLYLVPRVIG